MNLSIWCEEYWSKKSRLSIKNFFKSDDGESCSLHEAIAAYQSERLYPEEEEHLLQYLTCKNGRIKKVWKRLRNDIRRDLCLFYQGENESMESAFRQVMECCSIVIGQQVEKCLQKFDPERAEEKNNQQIASLISKYIQNSIHLREIYKEAGIQCLAKEIKEHLELDQSEYAEKRTFRHEPPYEQLIDAEDAFQKIFVEQVGLQQIRARHKLDDYLKETLSDQHPQSARARQQKKRMRAFIREKWNVDEMTLDYLIEKFELLLVQARVDPFQETE